MRRAGHPASAQSPLRGRRRTGPGRTPRSHLAPWDATADRCPPTADGGTNRPARNRRNPVRCADRSRMRRPPRAATPHSRSRPVPTQIAPTQQQGADGSKTAPSTPGNATADRHRSPAATNPWAYTAATDECTKNATRRDTLHSRTHHTEPRNRARHPVTIQDAATKRQLTTDNLERRPPADNLSPWNATANRC